jgi:hypothetical protein
VEDDFRITVRGGSVQAPLADVAAAYFDSLGKLMDTSVTGS